MDSKVGSSMLLTLAGHSICGMDFMAALLTLRSFAKVMRFNVNSAPEAFPENRCDTPRFRPR